MDPPPPTTTTTTTTTEPPHTHSLPPLPTPKLRLMCSYNGHILPRPQTKSLTYASGETRIVSVDRRTTASSITSLSHHLSKTLYNNQPFTLKYQLPNEDLDSLITITTDEDLQNMLEEHDRIVSSTTPCRIRLFLFPTQNELTLTGTGTGSGTGSLLRDPKSEMWFSDALKSSMIVSRGLSDGSDESGSVQESMVLETCSSFGSINSSLNNEDSGGNKVKLAVNGLTESDNCGRVYHDQVIQVVPETESIIYNPLSTVHMQQRNVQVSGYQIQQQPVQYVQSGAPHYVQYPTGQVPMSSYYPMYAPYQQQQQQTNQPYPIYVMPIGPTDQSYNMSVPADVNGNLISTHVANAHVTVVPERATVIPQMTPSNVVPSHSAQPMDAIATPMTHAYENEYDNDLAYAQIYKSQPSASVFPPQKFETMKKPEPVGLGLSDSSIGTS